MPATDKHKRFLEDLAAPADNFAAVTKSDTVDLTTLTRALYIGTAGDVRVVQRNGTAVTFKAVPAGAILPIRCARVNSTGTTAADIVALW